MKPHYFGKRSAVMWPSYHQGFVKPSIINKKIEGQKMANQPKNKLLRYTLRIAQQYHQELKSGHKILKIHENIFIGFQENINTWFGCWIHSKEIIFNSLLKMLYHLGQGYPAFWLP